jgi:hypothetical protein
MPCILDCSHSDINLVELGKETVKEDDRAALLEGGLTRSASMKIYSSSIKANLIRSLAMINLYGVSFVLCL